MTSSPGGCDWTDTTMRETTREENEMNGPAAERVAEVFVEAADTLVEDFDLVDLLYRLTERTTELASASASGLLLGDLNGRLSFVAASDERTHLLELFQLQVDQGPCLDCFQSGRPVTETDLTTAGARWPDFARGAAAAGFRSVHAFPLRLRGDVIGVVGIFSDTRQTLDPTRTLILQALADMATIAILQERAVRRGELLAEQLQGALNSRIVIEQAKGALAQIHGGDVDEAFGRLRTYVRDHNVRLMETAEAVLTRPETVPGLTDPTR